MLVQPYRHSRFFDHPFSPLFSTQIPGPAGAQKLVRGSSVMSGIQIGRLRGLDRLLNDGITILEQGIRSGEANQR
jgi:hypothetical protein